MVPDAILEAVLHALPGGAVGLFWGNASLLFVTIVLVIGLAGAVWMCRNLRQRNSDLRASLAEAERLASELHQTHAALRRLNQVQTEMGRLARVGGWEFVPSDGSATWTEEMYRIFDLPRDHHPNLPDTLTHFPAEAARTVVQHVERAVATGEPFEYLVPFTTAQGEALWVRGMGKVDGFPAGPLRLYGAFQDVTDQQQRELRLVRTNEELEHQNTALEHFTHLASHDLREPVRRLATTVALLETCEGERLSEEGRELLRFITQSSSRLEELIAGLRSLASVERAPLAPRAIDLAALVSEVIEDHADHLAQRSVQVTLGELPTVTGIPVLLRILFDNLLRNALRHARSDGFALHIEGRRVNDEWQLYVRNTASSVVPADRERAFQAFVTLDPRAGGTGLGLAICRRVVTRHGGRIWMESDDDATTVTFTIPETTNRLQELHGGPERTDSNSSVHHRG